jgi:two-component system cell cycle sensor histidine kinase/response regulator CckA
MNTVEELSSPMPLQDTGKISVLVVDDETAVRSFAARVLEREGYAVFEAKDGVDALALIKQAGMAIEVVVSDIVMPRLNGVELMQALALSNPELPVILMSGYATGALAELGIAAPCAILAKPFPSERLLEEVRRCVRPRKVV